MFPVSSGLNIQQRDPSEISSPKKRTVIDWMTDASRREWPKVRQLSGGIGGCDFNCFLNNRHGTVEGARSRGFRPLQREQRRHIIHVRGPDGLLNM